MRKLIGSAIALVLTGSHAGTGVRQYRTFLSSA